MACVSRISVRRSGAFSQRDRVGCEARSSPLSGSRPQASLKAGSLRRSSRSSPSGYPQAMAKMRARRMSAQRVGDLVRITVVGDDRRKRIDQTKPLVGTGQQQHAAIGTYQASVESGCDLLLADTWQRERQKRIVVVGGHGKFCPRIESGVSTQSLRDSRRLYHARQRIPAMR